MQTMTLRQLRIFVAVARDLSFARAAESLHLTAPAVSMQIKELEAKIQLPLFVRTGRKVALTSAGEYFLFHARKTLSSLKEAEDSMARFARLDTGRLTVGMVSTANYFVPQMLASFHEEHPGVEIKLQVTQNRQQMFDLLGANEIDLAIMGRPPENFASRAEPFAAHPFVFVAPPDHELLKIGQPAPVALNQYGFIVRESESGTRNAMQRYFHEHRIAPPILMEMSSNEAIKQAVIARIGLAFLSLHTVRLELSNELMRILPVLHSPVMRVWYVVSMSNRVLSPSADAFRRFVLERGESWLARLDKPHLDAMMPHGS